MTEAWQERHREHHIVDITTLSDQERVYICQDCKHRSDRPAPAIVLPQRVYVSWVNYWKIGLLASFGLILLGLVQDELVILAGLGMAGALVSAIGAFVMSR